MHKVDAPGATPANEFTDGDPQSGVPATTLEAKFMNTVQRELLNVVEGAGLTLDEQNDGQLQEAISEMIGPPVVVPPVPTMEITRHGPGEWNRILTGSGGQTINLLEIGPVQAGDIIDVQCRPDIRRARADGFVTVRMRTLGTVQIRSYDTQLFNGGISWNFYVRSAEIFRNTFDNPTTKLLVLRGGELTLRLEAASTNAVGALVTESKIFAMITRYSGVNLTIR